jgi:uncharacterized protein (DUF305 family)
MKKQFATLVAVLGLALIGCQATISKDAPNASTAPVASQADRDFIDGMVPHHQSALSMADDALAKATHAELKTFAQQVKTAQSAEIAEMKGYRLQWFGSAETPSMDMANMMNMAAGPNYDAMWANEMVTHHQAAIEMANKALSAATRVETKAIAQRIIDAQKKEQDQLRAWSAAWTNAK